MGNFWVTLSNLFLSATPRNSHVAKFFMPKNISSCLIAFSDQSTVSQKPRNIQGSKIFQGVLSFSITFCVYGSK